MSGIKVAPQLDCSKSSCIWTAYYDLVLSLETKLNTKTNSHILTIKNLVNIDHFRFETLECFLIRLLLASKQTFSWRAMTWVKRELMI